LEARRALGPLAVWLALSLLGVASMGLLLAKLHFRWPGQHRYEVRVEVSDAKGVVSPIDEVRISGVVVGRIVDTKLDGSKAVLTASIGPQFGPLYRDARLRLRPRTPLEDMYLDVTDRGTPRAGRVPDGGRLAADRTRTPVHIGEVL